MPAAEALATPARGAGPAAGAGAQIARLPARICLLRRGADLPMSTPPVSPAANQTADGGWLRSLPFQIGLLTAMQALLLVNNVTMVAVNGLAGYVLTDQKWLATLPVTGYVLGGALWAMPAAMFMRRFGRRAGYTLASFAAIGGALLAWYAMVNGSLMMLCTATFIAGFYNAFGASLRFAAASWAALSAPNWPSGRAPG